MTRFLASITNRIFVATALVAVLSSGVAVWVVNVMVTAEAERELRRGLAEAGLLVEQYRNQSLSQLAQQARLVADLPKLKAAVETKHPPTVAPLAADYQRQLGANLFVIADEDGRVLADYGADVGIGKPGIFGLDAGTGERTWFLAREDRVLQVVTVPILTDPTAPDLLGTLSVGVALDEPFASRIKDLSASEIAFVFDGRIRASTLKGTPAQDLAALATTPATTEATLGGDDYVLMRRSLAGANTREAAPDVLVLRSRTERLRFLRTLQTVLGGMALVAVAMATLLSYAVARTITRPLGTITAEMREMAATGDLTRRVHLPANAALTDEDALLLATTFNTMTASIARFQQEAAQRERLSSLGRLSTVVAHEIRNPLMIIKAALRTLRRADAPPERVQASVADISEEVDRLNRLVNEVLDYARPIRFDLAPVELGAIVEGSWAAVATASPGVTCRVRLDPSANRMVSDGERLRLALVNLLSNAAQAVRQNGGGEGGDTPEIEVSTRACPGDRIEIAVRDRGPGIAPADLPRIFDPFFTTKPTGSGIGLAITRNIVEGLGGALRATSERGAGTTMTVELPRIAPAPSTAAAPTARA